MIAYALYDGPNALCKVEISHRAWMPVKPRIPRVWLQFFIAQALRRYFNAASVVKA